MSSAQAVFRRDAQVIGLVGLAHGTSHFYHLALAALFPWLKDAFALSYSELGLLMTVFFIVSGTGQALAGFVVDRFGALPVLLSGIALLGISAIGLAASQNYPMLLFFAGVSGLGNSVFHPADFTLLNRRVTTPRLGHAFSAHGLAGAMGWAIAPVFMAGLATLFSWQIALFAASSVALVVFAVLFAFREMLDPREVSESVARRAHTQSHVGALGFLRLPAVWMCFAFFLISALSFGGIQSFAPSALRDLYSVPFTFATGCITAYMLASAAGLIAGGFIATRTVNHDRVIAVAFGMLAPNPAPVRKRQKVSSATLADRAVSNEAVPISSVASIRIGRRPHRSPRPATRAALDAYPTTAAVCANVKSARVSCHSDDSQLTLTASVWMS